MTDEIQDVIAAEFADYNDDQLRELMERVAQIRAMTEHPGWALYQDLVLAETVTRQRAILAGRLTHDDYSRETGWVAGALAALGAPEKQAAKLELRIQFEKENLADEGDTN